MQLLRAVVREGTLELDAVVAPQSREGGGDFRCRRDQGNFDEIEEVVARAVGEDVLIEAREHAMYIPFDGPAGLQCAFQLRRQRGARASEQRDGNHEYRA
jgi:hypothetical protein